MKGFGLAIILALAVAACKVQPLSYVGLYIDNSISIDDTIEPNAMPQNIADTAIVYPVDTTAVIEAEELRVSLHRARDIIIISPERVYQYEVKEWLRAITDSLQVLQDQMIEIQKQVMVLPDSIFMGKQKEDLLLDSLLHPDEVDLKQLLQIKNDTIDALRKQLNELQNSSIIKAED
jgi:hypothetical protein